MRPQSTEIDVSPRRVCDETVALVKSSARLSEVYRRTGKPMLRACSSSRESPHGSETPAEPPARSPWIGHRESMMKPRPPFTVQFGDQKGRLAIFAATVRRAASSQPPNCNDRTSVGFAGERRRNGRPKDAPRASCSIVRLGTLPATGACIVRHLTGRAGEAEAARVSIGLHLAARDSTRALRSIFHLQRRRPNPLRRSNRLRSVQIPTR